MNWGLFPFIWEGNSLISSNWESSQWGALDMLRSLSRHWLPSKSWFPIFIWVALRRWGQSWSLTSITVVKAEWGRFIKEWALGDILKRINKTSVYQTAYYFINYGGGKYILTFCPIRQLNGFMPESSRIVNLYLFRYTVFIGNSRSWCNCFLLVKLWNALQIRSQRIQNQSHQ